MSATRYSFIIPIIVGCAQFMHQFDGAVIATALPSMADSLKENPLTLNLAITTYLLALAVFVPVSGWMADRFGAKRIYMLAIMVFTVSSVLCGLSDSLLTLVLSRTLQGIGGAMMTPVGRVIVVKSAPKRDMVKAMNYITIPGALAPLLGPSVGGFIVTYFSWPWIFFINLPIGVIGLLLVWVHIPEIHEDNVARFDALGFVLAGVGLATLVFGFEAMGRGLIPTPIVVALLVVGVACTLLYIRHARRAVDPIIDLQLLNRQTFAASLGGGALFYMGTTSVVFLISLLLQVGFGYSAFEAGLTTLAGAFGSMITRFTFRPVLRATGFRQLLVINSIVMGLYLASCAFFQASTPFAVILVILFIGGFARSTQFTTVQSLAYIDMPLQQMSRATSFSSMAQQLAQSFGVGLVAVVMHLAQLWHGHASLTAADVSPGFGIIALAAFSSFLIFQRLPQDTGHDLESKRPRRS
jgi:EmrB/QacA subfamily drug resistance transporter